MQAHIDVDEAGAKNIVASRVPVTAGWHIHIKRVQVEPLIGSLWPVIRILSRHNVGPQRVCVAILAITGVVHAKWSEPVAALNCPDSVQLPAAYEGVCKCRHAGGETATFADGQIIDTAEDESVPDIEV